MLTGPGSYVSRRIDAPVSILCGEQAKNVRSSGDASGPHSARISSSASSATLRALLVRLGYPPVIVLKQQRPAYLAALQRADDGDYGPLGEILARAMYDNLNRFIVPSLAGPARLVPLAALVDKDLSLPALRQAAQRGRLDAFQRADGVWRSSRKAVEEYRRTRQRRRVT